jgi:guanylate kinase
LPPSWEELEKRLRDRGTDSEDEIRRRLVTARRELGFLPEYDYALVNDELDKAGRDLVAVVCGERRKLTRQPMAAKENRTHEPRE